MGGSYQGHGHVNQTGGTRASQAAEEEDAAVVTQLQPLWRGLSLTEAAMAMVVCQAVSTGEEESTTTSHGRYTIEHRLVDACETEDLFNGDSKGETEQAGRADRPEGVGQAGRPMETTWHLLLSP